MDLFIFVGTERSNALAFLFFFLFFFLKLEKKGFLVVLVAFDWSHKSKSYERKWPDDPMHTCGVNVKYALGFVNLESS